MKIRLILICMLVFGVKNLYGQTANYKAQLNKKVKDQVYLKKEVNNVKMKDLDSNQTPKYRKRKSPLNWQDNSTIKHQSYKQQNKPK